MANRPWFQAFLLLCFASFMLLLAIFIRPDDKQMGILQMGSFLYEEGERRLLQAYERNPEDLLTLKAIGELYAVLGHPEKQIRYLSEYIELKPKDTVTRMELAKVYSWNLMRGKAMEQYQAILKYDDVNVDALRLLADNYAWAQQLELAIDCYRQISEVQPLNEEDQRALIQLYIGNAQLRDALAMAEKMYRQFEDKITIKDYLNIADLYSWTGRPALADTILGRMLSRVSMSWDLRLAYVDWYLNIGRPSRAIERLQDWVALPDPYQLKSHEKLVEIYQMERKNSHALKEMALLIEHPDSTEDHLARYFWMQMDAKLKKKAWKTINDLSPLYIESNGLWKTMAFLAMDVKEWEQAKKISLDLMDKNDQDPEIRGLLFRVYEQMGFNHLALEQLNWMLTFHGDDPSTLHLAMDFLRKERDFKQGLEIAMRGMSLFPGEEDYRESAIYFSTMLKKHDLAIQLLEKSVKERPSDYSQLKNLLDILLAIEDRERGLKWTNHGWKSFNRHSPGAYELANYTGWFGDYRLQLERFSGLEELEEGIQYDKEMIEAAIGIPDWSFALSLLEPRSLRVPLSPKELLALVQCYIGVNRHEAALVILNSDQAIQEIPHLNRMMSLSDLLFEMKRSGEGINILIQLYEDSSMSDESLRKEILRRVLWLENPKLQLAIYQRFGDLDAESSLPLVEILLNNKDFDQASQQLSRVPAEKLESLPAQKLIRWIALERKDQAAHLASLGKLIQMSSDDLEVKGYLQERSSLFHQLGRIDEAETDARQLLKDNPNNHRAMVVLAYVHYDKKQFSLAAKLLKDSGSKEVYDRFLRGASLLRFPAGYREGMRVFQALLRDFESEESFKKWNLVLDIGYEINSPFYIERAWTHIMQDYFNPKVLPRYALHLLYTDRRAQAEAIYQKLTPSEELSYEALQKVFEPKTFRGNLSQHEKMALADYSDRNRHWIEAIKWLP